jgi:ribonuclease HI
MASLYTDGGHSAQSGKEAWGSVVDAEGNDLIKSNIDILDDLTIRKESVSRGPRYIIIAKFDDVSTQQNNGAELLAFYAGLKISMKHGFKTILCDSQLIVDYWGKGHVNKDKVKTMDKTKYAFIVECGKLRKIFEGNGCVVRKIPGDDNLADLFGHCKKIPKKINKPELIKSTS